MSEENKRADGLMADMMHDMPRWVKGLVYVMVAPALVLTMSAIMLQLNAGKLIEEFIDRKYDLATAEQVAAASENTVSGISTLLEHLTDQISDNSIAVVELRDRVTLLESTDPLMALAVLESRFADVDDQLADMRDLGLNTKLMRTDNDVEALRKWVCRHSSVQGLKADAPVFCDNGGR